MRVLVDARLFDHPKLIRLAKLIGRSPAAAAGHLVSLWAYASEYALGGSGAALDSTGVCSGARWVGASDKFVRAMAASGWIDKNGETWQIHDWHEHQGKYIQKMLTERARKRRGCSTDVPRTIEPPGSVAVPCTGSGAVDGNGSPHREPVTGEQLLWEFLGQAPGGTELFAWVGYLDLPGGEKRRDEIARELILTGGKSRKHAWIGECMTGKRDPKDPWGDGKKKAKVHDERF